MPPLIPDFRRFTSASPLGKEARGPSTPFLVGFTTTLHFSEYIIGSRGGQGKPSPARPNGPRELEAGQVNLRLRDGTIRGALEIDAFAAMVQEAVGGR